MRAIASPSVNWPHQPVEIVQRPNPTSLTLRSVFLQVRKRMGNQLNWEGENLQRRTPNAQYRMQKALDGRLPSIRDWTLGVRRSTFSSCPPTARFSLSVTAPPQTPPPPCPPPSPP